MKTNSSEKTKLKTKKVRFNSNAPKTATFSLEEDLDGCLLVIPRIFGMNRPVTLHQWRFPEYHF